jgi:hypothetical protein
MEARALDALVEIANRLYDSSVNQPASSDSSEILEAILEEARARTMPSTSAAEPPSTEGELVHIPVPEETLNDAEEILRNPELYEVWLTFESGMLREAGLKAGWVERVQGVLRDERQEFLSAVELQRTSPAARESREFGIVINVVRNWVGDKVRGTGDAVGRGITKILGAVKISNPTKKRILVGQVT